MKSQNPGDRQARRLALQTKTEAYSWETTQRLARPRGHSDKRVLRASAADGRTDRDGGGQRPLMTSQAR